MGVVAGVRITFRQRDTLEFLRDPRLEGGMETGLRMLDFDAVWRGILLRLHDTRANKSGETRGEISESCVESIWKRTCRPTKRRLDIPLDERKSGRKEGGGPGLTYSPWRD